MGKLDKFINDKKEKKKTDKSEDELGEKKLLIDKYYTDIRYKKVKDIKEKTARLQNLDFRVLPDNYYDEIDEQDEIARIGIKNKLPFITKELTNFVPLYAPSLILIGATTGAGKTTVATNIVYRLMKFNRKSLIISNEELKSDSLNRIASLKLGYNINKREDFTNEMEAKLREERRNVGEYVRIVDPEYREIPGVSTSVEGIEAILKSLSEQEKFYDCIILDYYQKVTDSHLPNAKQYEVLSDLTNTLDHYYKIIKAPIIVLAQLHPDQKGEATFESRIKCGKSILISSTFALEVKPNKEEEVTEWICHKHRFGQAGKSLRTKWVKGQYKDT